MSRNNYDNWERLVAAVLRKQQLWELFHAQSRSPSILSEESDLSSSSHLDSHLQDAVFNFSNHTSSSTYRQEIEGAVAKLHRAPPKLVFVSDFSPDFDVEDVFLNNAQLLGRGTFGSTYKAAMKNGVNIVVKRLKPMNISEMEFKHRMEIVGNVRHENIAALRAYYASKDERLILYDYFSNGSVFALLHGQTGKDQMCLDWETRVRIAIGAARGIAQIHAQNSGKLVHGNLKSSNIFLNPQQYGCVSDLGIANMIGTTFRPTALCYAPEVKNTQDVSQSSDVYSFGILLLELLTRKSPVNVHGGCQAVDVIKLVNSVKSRDWAGKVFDPDLFQHHNIKDEMVKMLQIGIKCVAKSIKRRPKMSVVVKILEDNFRLHTGNHVFMERKLVGVEDGIPRFRLKYVLMAPIEYLGRGMLGTSYKGRLGDGKTIMLKEFNDVNVKFNEFQQHVEVIGRMQHENVSKLKAYYFSRNAVVLVYDYYNQGSLSALLHGTNKIPLDLESRLKIAVGAARGIAHIHRQDGGKFVHGNIKSSNILLNGQQYGLVSDAGLAILMKPIKPSYMITGGYYAPEREDSRYVSQASDVYSFGVVLLELVTGKPSVQRIGNGMLMSLAYWVQLVIREEWADAQVLDREFPRNRYEDAMVLLKIAMGCAIAAPEQRPRMTQVVRMLEKLSGMEPSNESGLEVVSRLEDLVERLMPTLTP